MANIIESNVLIEVHHPNGDIDRNYPITKAENVIGVGNSTKVQTEALKLLAVNSYIVDDTTGITYKIGIKDGKLYREESDVSIKDLLDTIKDVTNPDIVDKSMLNAMITMVTVTFNNPNKLATSDMRTSFSTAIDSAQSVADNTSATQDEVDNAVTLLETANATFMNESSAIVTARNNLSAMLSNANTAVGNTEMYTPGSITLLQSVITASEVVYNSTEIYAAQTYIDQKNNLQTAISNLSKKANKTNLSDGISSATAEITNSSETWKVTEATMNAFNTALTNAQSVVDNPNAVQTDADNALTALNNAKKTLVAEHASISSALSSLSTTITQAAGEVAKIDMYTSESISSLQGVLTGAQELYNDETIHIAQDYIDKKAELLNAINALVIKTNNSNLVSLIATVTDNLNDSTKLATNDMKIYLTNAIGEAQTVADNESATETEIDNAITALQQANTTYITGSEEIVTAKNDLNTVISSANTEVTKTSTYHSSSITALQSKLTEAQTLYDDSVVHVATDYVTKKDELQSEIDGMVNISYLVAKINEVENDSRITEYLNDEDSHHIQSVLECKYALRDAKQCALSEGSQTQLNINARLSELSKTYDTCVQECIELTNLRNRLNTLMTSANTYLNDNPDQYTPSSINKLRSTYNGAQSGIDDARYNKTTLDDYANALQSDINGLTLRADFIELNSRILEAHGLDGTHIGTPEMKTALSNAITSAQAVNSNANSTQAEVDNAKTALQTACNEYITQSNAIVSARNDLNTVLTAANTELSKTNTYTQTSISNLQTKVTAARSVYNDTTIHPASDYITHRNNVQSAINNLVKTPNYG